MNSNTIKTYALIGTSLVSVALLYRNFYLAGLLEGALKSRKKAVNSALEYSQNVYLDRVNKLLETCKKQETPSDDLKAILDLMDCPL
jgi:hypothetical protein|nr:MAG TPA: hypothetical protein [Caudoviricetes sp.]